MVMDFKEIDRKESRGDGSSHRRRKEESNVMPVRGAEEGEEEDGALSAYGDISLSDAFNISASTTEENKLQPRRARPPMPRQVRARRVHNEDTEAVVQQSIAVSSEACAVRRAWLIVLAI